MSDMDDLVNREYDENNQWRMEEWQNTPTKSVEMSKAELAQLENLFRRFIDFVDTRDSRLIANRRTREFAVMLEIQHWKNKRPLTEALAHIIAVKGSSDVK